MPSACGTVRTLSVFAVAVAGMLVGCGRSETTPVATPHPSPTIRIAPTAPPIAIVGSEHAGKPIRLTQLRDGKIRYTVVADQIRGRYAGVDTGSSRLVNPHITFVAAGGKQLVAVAPAGTVVEKDKTVLMNGGVHARSQDGMTLAGDSLRYDDQTQNVHGEGNVVVTFPHGERLTGDTVDWNLRSGEIEMNTGSR
jgi:LPS export ABC transporter protein LptC